MATSPRNLLPAPHRPAAALLPPALPRREAAVKVRGPRWREKGLGPGQLRACGPAGAPSSPPPPSIPPPKTLVTRSLIRLKEKSPAPLSLAVWVLCPYSQN